MFDSEVLKIANTFINTDNPTVRKIANITGWSKSTVHRVLCENLKDIDISKWEKCQDILEKNKKERNMRGGLANKLRYSKMKK